MGVSKAVYNGKTLIDLTQDTVTETKLLSGYTAHKADGTIINGGITTKQAATYTPTTTDQTFAEDEYLYGNVVLKGDPNLLAANIKDGVTIFGITGTYIPVEPETIINPVTAGNFETGRDQPTTINIGSNIVGFFGGTRICYSSSSSKWMSYRGLDTYDKSLTRTFINPYVNISRGAGGYVDNYGLIIAGQNYGGKSTSVTSSYNTAYSIDTSLTKSTLSTVYPYSGLISSGWRQTEERHFSGRAIFGNSGSNTITALYSYDNSLTLLALPNASTNRSAGGFFNNKNKELAIVGGNYINDYTIDRYDTSFTKLDSSGITINDTDLASVSGKSGTIANKIRITCSLDWVTVSGDQSFGVRAKYMNGQYTCGDILNDSVLSHIKTSSYSWSQSYAIGCIGNKYLFNAIFYNPSTKKAKRIVFSVNTSLTMSIEDESSEITYTSSSGTGWANQFSDTAITFPDKDLILIGGGTNFEYTGNTETQKNLKTVRGFEVVTE